MKKRYIVLPLVAVGTIGVAVFGPAMTARNHLVDIDQNVERSIGMWQSQIQRRYDLLPNAARTAETSGQLEKSTQEAVASARASMPAILKVDPTKIMNDPALQKQLIEAQAQSSAAVSKVNAAVESTPNLKSVDLFHDVMKQIEGTENRINRARTDTVVQINEYNTYVRKYPGFIAAAIFGFHVRPNFQAASQDAPELFKK